MDFWDLQELSREPSKGRALDIDKKCESKINALKMIKFVKKLNCEKNLGPLDLLKVQKHLGIKGV